LPEGDLEYLQKQARRCRGAAGATLDLQTRQTLLEMADEYEQRAEALELDEKRATKLWWGKANERVPEPVRVGDGPGCAGSAPINHALDMPGGEEHRRRSDQPEIGRAKTRILQRIARGLPVNVFERKLITGDLPPGL
jgi:hypothetical protein